MKTLLKMGHFLKDAWLVIGITFILFLSLEGMTRGYYFVRNRNVETVVKKKWSALDTFRDLEQFDNSWGIDYLKEHDTSFHASWRSYVYWRRDSFSGKYVNVNEDGIRKTYNNNTPSDSTFTIFVFGGSTVWGTGSRDDFTIPSFISKELQQRGYKNFHVVNYGESGYVSTQEILTLILELRKNNVPDIVIFYNGSNDCFSAIQNKVAGIPQNEINRRSEFNTKNHFHQQEDNKNKEDTKNLIEHVVKHSAFTGGVLRLRDKIVGRQNNHASTNHHSWIEPYLLEKLTDDILHIYMANIAIVESLSNKYGFESYVFWQPTIFTKNKLSPQEEKFEYSPDVKNIHDLTYTNIAALEDKPDHFYNLSDIFGDMEKSVYIDFVHVGEEGNAIIGDAIVDTLLTYSPMLSNK